MVKHEGISAAVLGQDDPVALAMVVPDSLPGRFLFADEVRTRADAMRAVIFLTREADGCPLI